jgi:1-acyl-sn-glycerol-3-phosphate acyltransferase
MRISRYGQIAVAILFRLFVATQVRGHIRLARGAVVRRRTIIVLRHKRDLDIPVLVRALFGGPRHWRWAGSLVFAGRSDLYTPGFLALQFPQLRFVRRLLYPLAIGPILHRLGVVPVSKAGPRLVAEWIDALIDAYGGVSAASTLLAPDWLSLQDAAPAAGITLDELRTRRHVAFLSLVAGPECLRPDAFRRIRLRLAQAARASLVEVVVALQHGYVLVMAPEGNLSPDGGLQPFRSGMYRLLQQVPGAAVLPVAITYDLLDEGPLRAFVRVGPAQHRLAALERRETETRIRMALAAANTATIAQLAAAILLEDLEPDAEIAVHDLAALIAARATALAREGKPVDDRLLDSARFSARFARFLAAVEGRGLQRDGTRLLVDRTLIEGPVDGWQTNPLGYAYNELLGVSGPTQSVGKVGLGDESA